MFKSCSLQDYRIEFVPTRNGEVRVRGYLAIWGQIDERDCYDTWFDRTRPPELGLDLLPIAFMYEHNGDGSVRQTRIGKVVDVEFDDIGIAYTAVIDMSLPRAKQAVQEIKSGELATSSGSSPHLARFDDDGRFVDWLLAEVSLTRYPCEHRMPLVEVIRAENRLVLTTTAPPADAPQTHEAVDGQLLPSDHTDAPSCACTAHEKTSNEKRGTRMFTLEELGFAGFSTSEIVQAILDNFGREMLSSVYNAVFAVDGTDVSNYEALLATAMNEFPNANQEELALLVQVLFAVINERDDAESEIMGALNADDDEAEEMPAEEETERADEEELQRSQEELAEQVRSLQNRIEEMATRSDTVTPELLQIEEDTPMIQVRDRRYDGFNAYQLAAGYEMLRSAERQGRGHLPSESYVRAMAHKIERETERDENLRYNLMDSLEDSGHQVKAIRADELVSVVNNSTWAGDFFSTSLWEKMRTRPVYETLLAAGMEEEIIPQGSNTFKQLAEGADVDVYYAAETEDATSSTGIPSATVPIGSNNFALKTVSVSKVSGRIIVTGEMTEDVILSDLNIFARNLETSLAKGIEAVLLFGDTETGATGNINSDDGALAATSKFLAMDGMAKLPLVTNTANAYDAGTLAISDYNEVAKLLGVNGLNPENVVFIVDKDVYFKSRALDELETLDKFGQGATVLTGRIPAVYGSPLLASDQMFLAETDGKINTTIPSGTLLGRILAISAPRWKVGWKRRIEPEFQRWAGADANEIVVHARFGLAYADTDAAAIGYNITV